MPGAGLVPAFRATAVSWAVAKYPAQAIEFSNAAFAAFTFTANQAHHAIAAVFAALAASFTADATAKAAFAAAGAVAGATVGAADETLSRAIWTAATLDALHVEQGETASVLAGSLLWPQGQPARLRSSWQEMKAALLAAGWDWQVWAFWYDDRLRGHVQDEQHELAYVRTEAALWDQGPAIVNAEIRRRIEAGPWAACRAAYGGVQDHSVQSFAVIMGCRLL